MGSLKKRNGLSSFLYHTSFTLFILILAALLVGAAWGLGEQAAKSTHAARWNLFALCVAFAALVVISLVLIWARIHGVSKALRAMPRPYIPIKTVDAPKKVARHIQAEYARTTVIAHMSSPTTAGHAGWGKPGSEWDGVHFRTFIMGTVPRMQELLLPETKLRRSDVSPLVSAAQSLDPSDAVLPTFVASYVTLVQKALYAGEEPTQKDAHAVQLVMPLIRNLVEIKRAKNGAGARAGERGREERGRGGGGGVGGVEGTRGDRGRSGDVGELGRQGSVHAHFAPNVFSGRVLEGHV